MIHFRCRTHRDPIQKLWQVSRSDDGKLAGRPIEGILKAGLRPGGWVPESRSLAEGLYCQACLSEGTTAPLPDYDQVDLSESGLLETPHIGLTANEFDLDSVWASMREHFVNMVVAEDDRKAFPPRNDSAFRTDSRVDLALKDTVLRLLGGGDLYAHQAKAIDAALDGQDVVVETANAFKVRKCRYPHQNALTWYWDFWSENQT